MKLLPQAIANGRNQNGTIAGKLKGTIAAQTPTGWRTVSASIPRETSSATRPWIVVGIAAAHSTISIIRATSARASPIVLPISAVTDWARSSRRRTSSSRSVKRRRPRSITLTSRHSGRAARAASTARSRSAAVESGTSASVSPVAGLVTSRCSSPELGTQAPPTKLFNKVMVRAYWSAPAASPPECPNPAPAVRHRVRSAARPPARLRSLA